jgi:hypothetical protein
VDCLLRFHLPAQVGLGARYEIQGSSDGKQFTPLVDKTNNTVTRYTEFDELPPTRCRFIRLILTDWPRSIVMAACGQRRRLRFITAAALVDRLEEAQREQTLSRMLARWARIGLVVLVELNQQNATTVKLSKAMILARS